MTNITKPTATELKKWRIQSKRAAAELKRGGVKPKPGESVIKAGFAFDDDRTTLRIITVELAPAEVDAMTVDQLADHIHDTVLRKAQEHTPPAGHA